MMESWSRVILEWVNCLGIAQQSIEDLQDLRNGIFYQKLVAQLSRGNKEISEITSSTMTTTAIDEDEPVSKFIKAEYPEFMESDDCGVVIPDDLYTASLLLTQCSQKVVFHRPMCVNLKHESQIQIKKFLELVLPYGRSLTREVIGTAITELGDATPSTPPSTPKPSRPLREFFNSPAARSAQSQRFANDRNRELRRLRAQLETEQFEKSDLLEDLRIQDEKLQNLQKKLHEKSQELKFLRNERLKPLTPESCRKNNRPSDSEERFKRELEQLESANAGLQLDLEKLEDEREELSRRLLSKDRVNTTMRQKFDQAERNAESLAIQLEMKSNELLDMRMNNEELREHIREIQRSSMGEQSFEMEAIGRARSPALLNSSEALSSIVDIQLQEAKEESAQLKIQLGVFEKKFETIERDFGDMKKMNDFLKERTSEFENVKIFLSEAEKRLFSSTEKVARIEAENLELTEKLGKCGAALESNKELLDSAEKRREILESELKRENSVTRDLEICLENEKSRVTELESSVARFEKKCEDAKNLLASIEDRLSRVDEDKKVLELSLEAELSKLEESQNSLKNEKSKVANLESLLERAKEDSEKWQNLLKSSEEKCSLIAEDKNALESRLEESTKKLEESENCLKNEKSIVANLESIVESAKKESSDLKNLLKLKEKQLAEMTESKKSLETNLEETKEKFVQSEAFLKTEKFRCEELQSTVENCKKDSESLRNSLESRDAQLLCLEKKRRILDLEFEEIKKKLEESEISSNEEKIRVKEREFTIAESKRECENLQNLLEVRTKKLSEITELKKIFEFDLEIAKKNLEDSEINSNNQRLRVTDLESAVSSAREESESLRNTLQSKEALLVREKTRIEHLESIVAQGEQDALNRQNMVEELKTDLDNVTLRAVEFKEIAYRSKIASENLEISLKLKEEHLAKCQQRENALETKLESRRCQISELELKCAEFESELSRAKEACETLKATLSSTEQLLLEAETSAKLLESELRKAEAKIREAEESSENLRREISTLEEEKTKILLAKAKFEERAKNGDEKIVILEFRISDCEKQIEELEKVKRKELENSTILREELRDKNSRIDSLTLRLEESEDREGTISARLEAAEKKVAELIELGEEVERQLAQEREQLSGVRAEKKSLEEELSSRVRFLAENQISNEKQIIKLEKELEESQNNLKEQFAANSVLKKNEIELQKIQIELEDKLSQERNQLEVTLSEKHILGNELASSVQSVANMKVQIEKIEKELEESKKNLQEQFLANSVLKQNEIELQKIKVRLEDKLSQERNQLEVILSDKHALGEELASSVQSAANMKVRIEKIEKELEESNKNLEENLEAKAALEKSKIDLIELGSKLESKLELERQKLAALRAEKDALDQKLFSHLLSAAELEERTNKIEKDLEESQKNLRDQIVANELLREEKLEQEDQKEKLEKELLNERERLKAVQSEKELLEEEASLYGRSNKNLGAKIVELKGELEAYSRNLEDERDASAALRKTELELNSLREKLENQLTEERNQLELVRTEKANLEKELSSFVRLRANLIEELSALQTELESSRKDLHNLREVNIQLKENSLEANSRIETLQVFEAQSSRLARDLESAGEECAALRERIAELSEESKERAEEIVRAGKQLEESNCEKGRLIENLEERNRSSSDLVASLEKRLLGSQNACAEAKLDEKLKEEALGVLRAKLEQLTKEKIESDLRMKEVILNLQEVRTSQDGVLEAQVKALKEKSSQLEEAEKELSSLKTSLESKSMEIKREKLKAQNTEKEFSILKDSEEKQSKQVQELEESLERERRGVKEWTKRCEDLKISVEDIARVSGSLKFELNELWDLVSRACPEVAGPREEKASAEILETERMKDAMQSLADDAKTIRKAFAILGESNDKLKNNMKEIAKVSRSLKLELNALWDSVRQACPELARPKEEISYLEETLKNPETTEISYAVQSFAEDAKKIRKAVSILSEANETLKDHLDGEKEIAKSSASEAERRKIELDDRITKMENERKKRDEYITLLVRRKKDLQELLLSAVTKRDEVDEELCALADRWRHVAIEAPIFVNEGSSACDELKHLQIRRTELDEILAKVNERHARSSRPLLKALCRIFLWSENKLQEAQLLSVKNEFSPDSELSDEQELLKLDIQDTEKVHEDLTDVSEKIDTFSSLLKSYEISFKSGVIKREASNEEKLQAQVEKISKERKEMKDKLDAMRTRNAKLEKNMDELRNENKKLKSEASSVPPTDVEELERLEKLTEKLEKEILRLQRDNEELSKNKSRDNNDETRLKEVHNEYGLKLEKIKQKMKTAYNEQIAKLNQEQEKAMKDKVENLRGQMEQQCRKYTEDIAKYKAHISDLSSRYWDVGEKLLAETQEKQAALQQLQQFKGLQQGAIAEANQQMAVTQSRQKTASLDRRDFGADRAVRDCSTRPGYHAVEVIEEETTTFSTRRHSVKSIQAMGNAFKAEDEEGEVFDSVFLADLKEGRCAPMGPDFDRLSELRMRNSMCRPHLRSSYAVETHVQPISLNEDDIKNGVTGDDVFNDSLSQSLLPGQKPKKKDRTQTSYKRPGPPTPSKNGGRLSLQGNELKSPGSRILRERNVDRRTTATPRGLKNLFGTSISKRQDENATSTPKGRRLSNIFRKQRTERN